MGNSEKKTVQWRIKFYWFVFYFSGVSLAVNVPLSLLGKATGAQPAFVIVNALLFVLSIAFLWCDR